MRIPALKLGRRGLLAAMVIPAAHAAPWLREEVVVSCDPELAGVVAALGAGFAAGPIRVFSAPPIQTVRLLAHHIQTDVLITRVAAVQDAAGQGLLRPGGTPLWRNRLCIASLAGSTPSPRYDRDALLDQLDQGKFAATDPSPASALDGQAVLDRLSLMAPLAGRIVGAADTADVADKLQTGAARLGLLHVTEPAGYDLMNAMPVPDDAYAPIVYAAALTKTAWSRHQDAFLAYLLSPDGRARARARGLEIAA